MVPSELPVTVNSAPKPWRQKLGRSTLLHGVLGAVIAYPVMLASIVLSVLVMAFFSGAIFKPLRMDSTLDNALSFTLLVLGLGVLPAVLGAIIYFGRQWLLHEKPRPSGMLVYALVCYFTPVLTFLLTSSSMQLADLVVADLQSAVTGLAVPVAGFVAGVLCIQIEKRLNKAS
jgi:hypothetical protein